MEGREGGVGWEVDGMTKGGGGGVEHVRRGVRMLGGVFPSD